MRYRLASDIEIGTIRPRVFTKMSLVNTNGYEDKNTINKIIINVCRIEVFFFFLLIAGLKSKLTNLSHT